MKVLKSMISSRWLSFPRLSWLEFASFKFPKRFFSIHNDDVPEDESQLSKPSLDTYTWYSAL